MIWKGTYLIPIFKTWPKYSGDPDCPIPSLNTDETPFGNYISSAGERWKGEYLNLRLELIDFVIKELEKDDAV